MLMHADNGGIDHLDSGIVGSGKRIYDAARNTSPLQTDEMIKASAVRTIRFRQITPGCS